MKKYNLVFFFFITALLPWRGNASSNVSKGIVDGINSTDRYCQAIRRSKPSLSSAMSNLATADVMTAAPSKEIIRARDKFQEVCEKQADGLLKLYYDISAAEQKLREAENSFSNQAKTASQMSAESSQKIVSNNTSALAGLSSDLQAKLQRLESAIGSTTGDEKKDSGYLAVDQNISNIHGNASTNIYRTKVDQKAEAAKQTALKWSEHYGSLYSGYMSNLMNLKTQAMLSRQQLAKSASTLNSISNTAGANRSGLGNVK